MVKNFMKKSIPVKIGIIAAALVVVLFTGCANVEDSAEVYETRNPEEVFDIIADIRIDEREAHSEMLIFPDEKEDYQEAYLHEENYGLSTAHQIVVSKQFEKDGYDEEVRRLLKTTCRGLHSYYTEDDFSLPAIVLVFNHNNCYEYALLDNDKMQIVYVCNTFLENMDFIKKEYRPLHYDELANEDANSYSIY